MDNKEIVNTAIEDIKEAVKKIADIYKNQDFAPVLLSNMSVHINYRETEGGTFIMRVEEPRIDFIFRKADNG